MEVLRLLQDKKLEYIPSGRDFRIKCLNPDHIDNDPSLRVDRITGVMNCLVCGFKGSIFKHFDEKGNWLLIRKEILKRKIADKLAENVGLEIPENAVKFEREWRGIKGETYKRFEAFEHNDPSFIGRVVFPIKNLAGKIVGFNGRDTSQSATLKYLIYPDRAKLPLYPARIEPIAGRVILVEGIFDMLNLHDKGLTNAVCAFGTKKLTKEKLNLLKIQGISSIDIMFDPDKAGIEAANEVQTLCESMEITTRIVTLKDKDPGELTAQQVIKLKEQLYGESSFGGNQAE